MDKVMFDFYRNALLGGGITNPLCAEYKNDWRLCGDDKDKMMKLAMRQQSIPYIATFAYRGEGLTLDYVKESFSDYINGVVINDCDDVKGYTYALYVDYDYDNVIDLSVDVSSYMWCKDVEVEVQQTKCPILYVSNKSCVKLTLDGYNCAVVYLFDESEVEIMDAAPTSNVLIYKYGNDCKVTKSEYCDCKVKEFAKELRL